MCSNAQHGGAVLQPWRRGNLVYRHGTMLHPVGKLPPAVYWRRRLFVGVVLLLILWIVWILIGGGGGSGKSSADGTQQSSVNSTSAPTTQATVPSTPVSTSTAGTVSAGTVSCTPAMLTVTAATGKKSYPVSGTPDLYLVVTNTSTKPCKQDLADKQIELRVYTGDVRVWGSHDCKIEPGTDVETLLPKKAVRRGIVWSGQTSAPGCAGTRLVAQAGTYTLLALLANEQSKPVTFQLTSTG